MTLLPVAVLLSVGCLFLLCGRFFRNRPFWGTLCLLTLLFAAGCLIATSLSSGMANAPLPADTSGMPSNDASHTSSTSHLSYSQNRMFVSDSLAVIAQWIGLILGLFFALTALDALRQSQQSPEFFGALLLCVAGIMLVGLANDLILMFVALELVAVPAYFFFHVRMQTDSSHDAAVKYVLLSILSTAFILFGFSFLYGEAGTTSLVAIQTILVEGRLAAEPHLAATGGVSRLGILALVFILAGLGLRMSVAPFHTGLPDVWKGSTTWQASWLAVAPKVAGMTALARLIVSAMSGIEEVGQIIILVMAAATMIVGAVMALFETNIKRILAYTTMAHGGFALIGLAVGMWDAAHPLQNLGDQNHTVANSLPSGVSACMFYLAGYAMMTSGLFAVLIYLAPKGHYIEYVDELSGLVRSAPLAAGCLVVFLLGLIGMPPFVGFWGRLFVLSSALSVRGDMSAPLPSGWDMSFFAVTLIAVLSIAMIAVVYLRIMIVVLFDPQIARARPSGGQEALATATFAALLTLGVGLLPGPVLGYFEQIDDHPGAKLRRQAGLSEQKKKATIPIQAIPPRFHLQSKRVSKLPPP